MFRTFALSLITGALIACSPSALDIGASSVGDAADAAVAEVAVETGATAADSSARDGAIDAPEGEVTDDLKSNPGKVSCRGTECALPDNFCCDGTSTRCAVNATLGGTCENSAVFLRCDEPADCAGGQLCCLGFGLGSGSNCSSDCGSGETLRLCKTTADCGGIGTCRNVTCLLSGLGEKVYRSCNTNSKCK
ncbi:MAG: hypothetical protein NVSMB1_17930 [Polyangiales bacterium]